MEDTKKQNSKFNIKELLIPLLTAVLFSVFLPIFMYTNNIEEASFTEVLPLILIFAGIGAGISAILYFCFRKNAFLTTVTSVALIMFLNNYAIICSFTVKLFHSFYSGAIVIFITLIAILILIINNYAPSVIKETTPKVLLLVISALLILNIGMALPKGIRRLMVSKKVIDEPVIASTISNDNLPNVYYLLFDEYSNTEVMKKYYDYDNSEFDRYLEEKGFAVSQNTMNGSWDTTVITTNYVSYDYVVDDTSLWDTKINIRKNNSLAKLFESMNYEVVGVGDCFGFGIPSVTQEYDNNSSTTEAGDSLPKIILENTAYKELYGVIYRAPAPHPELDVINAINYFDIDNPERHTGDNVFTFTYICSPHPPFLFDENGNMNTDNRNNWDDKSYYLNQYIYITKEIQQVIDNILAYDEDCVIILQSDHAIRRLAGITLDDRMKPLNAVYYRGEDISEIEGQSGVNTIRLVLNRLFDMDLEVLKVTE